MSEFAVFEVKSWPLVYLKLSGVPNNIEEFESYLKGFDLLYQQKRKFNLLIDTTYIENVSPYYIVRQGFHIHNNEEKTRNYVQKVALIIVHDFVKKIVNRLFSMRKPVCEFQIFDNIKEARNWIK